MSNLMLALAALATLWLDHLIWLAPRVDGGAMERAMVLAGVLGVALGRWVLTSLVLARSPLRGILPLRGAWLWTAQIGLGALGGLALLVAAGSSQAIADSELSAMPGWVRAAALLGATLPPVLLLGLLALAVNGMAAPRRALQAGALAAAVSGALGGLAVLDVMVAGELRHLARVAQATRSHADERDTEARQRLAALTDDDGLLAWNAFLGDDTPADLRQAALQRLAARPGLESALAAAIDCRCDNPQWTAALLRMIERIPFDPTPALAPAVRQAIGLIAADLADSARSARPDERDQYVDLYLAGSLQTVRAVVQRMAAGARTDLGAELQALNQALLASFPRSQAARSFPGEVAADMRRIRAALP